MFSGIQQPFMLAKEETYRSCRLVICTSSIFELEDDLVQEYLFQMNDGRFFIYGVGGLASNYKGKCGESILTDDQCADWINERWNSPSFYLLQKTSIIKD